MIKKDPKNQKDLKLRLKTWQVTDEQQKQIHEYRAELMEKLGRNVKLWEIYYEIIDFFFKNRTKK